MARHHLAAAFLVMGLLLASPASAEPVIDPAPVQVAVEPEVINLSAWEEIDSISCYVELPETFNPADIVQVSLTKVNWQVLAVPVESMEFPTDLVNRDGDTLQEMRAKFKYSKLGQYLNAGAGSYEFTLQVKHKDGASGTVTFFEGTATLHAIRFHIEENPVSVGGIMRLVVDFVAPQPCYAEAKGKVGSSDQGGFWRIGYNVPAGLQHWTLDLPVPVDAAPGGEVSAKMVLKLLDEQGGDVLREAKAKWKVPVAAAP
jgi:hypothetical protein